MAFKDTKILFLLLGITVLLGFSYWVVSALLAAGEQITNRSQATYRDAQGSQYGPVYSNTVTSIVVKTAPQTCQGAGGACRNSACSTYQNCSSVVGTCPSGQYCCQGACTTPASTPTPTPTPTPSTPAEPSLGYKTKIAITDIKVAHITSSQVKISWKTDDNANSIVYCGKTSSLEMEPALNKEFVALHSILLSGLSPNTKYFFQVKSLNFQGYGSKSAIQNFTTLKPGESPPAPSYPTGSSVDKATSTAVSTAISRILQLKARIAELVLLISKLQTQLQALLAQEGAAEIPSGFQFNNTLQYGDSGIEVTYLQLFLRAQGKEIYPEGLVTGFFGRLTEKALKRFQERYAIEILLPWGMVKGTGTAGRTTRMKINQLLNK